MTFLGGGGGRKMELVQKPQKSPTLFTSVDTTAFASILVILILIILVVASMLSNRHHAVSVDVPHASHPISMPGALRDDVMKVTILRDGRVYFGSDQIDAIKLPAKVQDRLKDRGVERKVYVVADTRTQWGAVKTVLDQVRSAGIIRIAFLVY